MGVGGVGGMGGLLVSPKGISGDSVPYTNQITPLILDTYNLLNTFPTIMYEKKTQFLVCFLLLPGKVTFRVADTLISNHSISSVFILYFFV